MTGPLDPPMLEPRISTIITERPDIFLGILSQPLDEPDKTVIFLDYDKGLRLGQIRTGTAWPWILIESSPGHNHLVIPKLYDPWEVWPFIKDVAPPGYSIAYLGRSYRPLEDGESKTPLFCIRISPKFHEGRTKKNTPRILDYHIPDKSDPWLELIEVLNDNLDKTVMEIPTYKAKSHGKVQFVEYQRARSLTLIGGVL